jgi:hypothetical protein
LHDYPFGLGGENVLTINPQVRNVPLLHCNFGMGEGKCKMEITRSRLIEIWYQ